MSQPEFDFESHPQNHPLFSDLAPHIVEKFFIFHRENPKIYPLFEKFAGDLRRAGREHYGIQPIAERIRWHLNVETQGDEFKINNNHLSCYARLLMIHDKTFVGFFRTRRTPGTIEGIE